MKKLALMTLILTWCFGTSSIEATRVIMCPPASEIQVGQEQCFEQPTDYCQYLAKGCYRDRKASDCQRYKATCTDCSRSYRANFQGIPWSGYANKDRLDERTPGGNATSFTLTSWEPEYGQNVYCYYPNGYLAINTSVEAKSQAKCWPSGIHQACSAASCKISCYD